MNENPYSAPNSTVVTPKKSIGFDLHPPRTVRAGRGADWVAEGFEMFKKKWLIWIGIAVVMLIYIFVLSRVSVKASYVGLVSGLFTYIWVGGLALGCHAQETKGELSFLHLFAGFQKHFGALFSLGVITSVLTIIIGFASFGSNYFVMIGLTGTEEDIRVLTNSYFTDPIQNLLLPLLISLLFYMPIIMTIWFAPLLIVLHDVPIVKAMILSFKGCLKNIIPFLLYSLILLVLFILSPLTIFLALLVLIPLCFTSLYCSYKDVYVATE